MLRKIMVILVAGVALAGASAAEAAPHGGGGGAGHMGGGFGGHVGGGFGGHIGGGSFGGAHLGGGFRGSHLGGQAFVGAGPRAQFGRDRGAHRHFGHVRSYGYWPGGNFGYVDDGCNYRYPPYNYYGYDQYRCYLPY